MSSSTTALIGCLGAGLATGLGALPIFLKKNYSKTTLDLAMGFSAGVMLAAAFFSLLIPGMEMSPKIFGELWGIYPVLSGLILGYLSIIAIHNFLPHSHFNKSEEVLSSRQLQRTTLMIIAIAIHNLPEGLAVGVGFGTGENQIGLSVAIAIALQNIPEGLIVAVGLLQIGARRSHAFLIALLSGLVEPVTGLIGYYATLISQQILPSALGFASGAMLFVICQEMFPELFRDGNEKQATLGVITGIVTMILIDYWV